MSNAASSGLGPWTPTPPIRSDEGPSPLPGASGYVADDYGGELACTVAPEKLAGTRFLAFDVLVGGERFVTFRVDLLDAAKQKLAEHYFQMINQIQTCVCVPLGRVERVRRVVLIVCRKAPGPARFCLTPLSASADAPPAVIDPVLPKGALLDEFGQSRLMDWPTRSRSGEEIVKRLKAQFRAAGRQRAPESFSRWGGWKEKRVEASGFFRTHHDGRRWWLVDPDGHLFWSAGVDCVHPTIPAEANYLQGRTDRRKCLSWMPEPDGTFGSIYGRCPYLGDSRQINYLQANLIRAFGPVQWYSAWSAIVLGGLRRIGFNTAGDWSDEGPPGRAGVPYVRPLDLFFAFERTPLVAGSFPDAFHPNLETDAAACARALVPTVGDPAMIGYFLTNEPSWDLPALGMLRRTHACQSRRALADFLRGRYRDDAGLSAAWQMPATLDRVAEGAWTGERGPQSRCTGFGGPFTPPALGDLTAFSTIMLKRMLSTFHDACRRADPDHLNLGVRWAGPPPEWAWRAMDGLDVVSLNWYDQHVPPEGARISAELKRPVMIGEFHFGALDAGLPAAGLYGCVDQKQRGRAYRRYVEHAASQPWCVGAHWFTLYDNSAMGRFPNGEWNNSGFFDVCHRPYEPLCRAARATHKRLYAVAASTKRPFAGPVEYLFPSR